MTSEDRNEYQALVEHLQGWLLEERALAAATGDSAAAEAYDDVREFIDDALGGDRP